MSTLIFDTETTGLVNFKLPDNDPSQPRLVQLGMMVLSDEWEVMHEVGLIVKPDGFEIPEIATSFHKITTEKALQFGIPLSGALQLFVNLALQCDTLVAHNIKFDRAVMFSELHRSGMAIAHGDHDYHRCTMMECHPILQLKQRGSNRPKWPSLTECIEYFFSEPLVDAHDALTDVRACARIYKHLMTVGGEWRANPEYKNAEIEVEFRGHPQVNVGPELSVSSSQPTILTRSPQLDHIIGNKFDCIQQQMLDGQSPQSAPGTPV